MENFVAAGFKLWTKRLLEQAFFEDTAKFLAAKIAISQKGGQKSDGLSFYEDKLYQSNQSKYVFRIK